MATKTVKWTSLRRGSKVLHKGKIRTVTIIDRPNRYNSFPKITFDLGSMIVSPSTYFNRISY